jgi:hypothetical protein
MPQSLAVGKKPVALSESLHRRLNSYALAASAAGVGMLALAQPAEGKIVYTKAHEVLGLYGAHTYSLDLNKDGISDFTLTWGRSQIAEWVDVNGAGKNGALGSNTDSASALKAGARIGRSGKFTRRGVLAGMRAWVYSSLFDSTETGRWRNVDDRYLGLRFLIAGKVHYGWARLSVKGQLSGSTAFMTGYAYETIPNKSIIAGQTHGADDAEPPTPASLTAPAKKHATLGSLAMGAPGLSTKEREESPEAARRRALP